MKWNSQSVNRVAARIVSGVSLLDGVSKQKAARFVNEIISRHTRGLFKDESWEAVNVIWKDLADRNVAYTITSSEYVKDHFSGMPTAKIWKFTIEFTNDKGRPTTLYGVITASGAGSVSDPLEKYDLVGYVS